jgi:hypothetical protein
MSKGDTPRPLSIPPASYDANWTRTFGSASDDSDTEQLRRQLSAAADTKVAYRRQQLADLQSNWGQQ